MKQNRMFRLSSLCFSMPAVASFSVAVMTLLTACGSAESLYDRGGESSLATVSIQQTAVRNQLAAGYCWAYASVGFLESRFLADTSKTVNLSEEALGFYRVVEELEYLTKIYQTDGQATYKDLADVVGKSSFQGWLVRRDPKDANFTMRDTFELIDKYGVVTEDAWNVKFDNEKKTNEMVVAVRKGYLDLMKKKGKSGAVSLEELMATVAAPKAFGSVPPVRYSFEGRTVSAVEMAHDVMGFVGSNYVLVSSESSRDLGKVIKALKLSLARGVPVPLGFGVNFRMLKDGTFAQKDRSDVFYDGISQEAAQSLFVKDGRHAVLVTDYVNLGGREGSMSPEELKVETGKSVDELAYLKMKNSWGFSAKTNESNARVSGSADGYYKLDLGYLRGEADAGALRVVVPADIAFAVK